MNELAVKQNETIIANMQARLSSPPSTEVIRCAGAITTLQNKMHMGVGDKITALYYADDHYIDFASIKHARLGTKGKAHISPDGLSRERFRFNIPGHKSHEPFESRWVRGVVVRLGDGTRLWRVFLPKTIHIVSGEMQNAIADKLNTARHMRALPAPKTSANYIADMAVVANTSQRVAEILGLLEDAERMAVLDIVRRGFNHK